eukprot:CAMPEP_0202885582 /NCGR_PEP_ID=MMETSP1391-20130828/41737_1 /ASSEMBLY_ACC=CAM_ASM_000867 /TAXON_ID=1034604 /ORGANISM="Chlamydomonas leiostraca, Strain SAG 11-49" /LENGTH=46 /DNA_ID= /DNA_START= /DNA_END= /DNA_ORIENTATION=
MSEGPAAPPYKPALSPILAEGELERASSAAQQPAFQRHSDPGDGAE